MRSTFLCVGLLIVGCGENPSSSASGVLNAEQLDRRVLELFGGQAGWEALSSPVRVEAFRVEPFQRSPTSESVEGSDKPAQFAELPILSGPVSPDQATLQSLVKVLGNADAYRWNSSKSCEFMPGVGIRFVGSRSTTEILFCFSCDELQVLRNGERVGHEDTDNIRAALVQSVQRIFPNDQVIQELNPAPS